MDVAAIIDRHKVFISFVYGDLIPKRPEYVWERLTRIAISRFEPWMIIGDLNELTSNHKKKGGILRNSSKF